MSSSDRRAEARGPRPSGPRRRPGWLAGVALALATGALPAAEDPVLARVDGHEIRRSDVLALVEAQPLGRQIALRERLDDLAESLIREEILFASVLATDFAGEPELRRRVKEMVVEHLVREHVRERLEVGDEDVRRYYREHEGAVRGETLRAVQAVRERREECEALARRLGSARELLAVAGAPAPGLAPGLRPELRVMNHAGPLGFEEALFALPLGENAVFESPFGCHVVRVVERVTPPLPPLAEVAPRIRALLERNEEIRLLRALLERARGHVRVERPPRP